MHDFPRLVEHLHLLFRIVVLKEDVDVRDHVVGELVGELVHGRLFTGDYLLELMAQLVHRRGTGAAGCLIGGDAYAADVREVVDGLERHHHLDGGAVGVADDVARTVEGVAAVDFGHH